MGWLKLDDAFGTHPKIAGLSDRAFRAHVLGMLYAAQHLTDGFIPTAVAPSKRILGELEGALWSPIEGGWLIHDFLEYNPPRALVLAEREAAKARRSPDVRTNGARRSYGRLQTEVFPDPSPTQPLKPKIQASAKPRNPLHDALAEIEGSNPLELTERRARTIGVALAEIKRATPDVTPDELRRRAGIYPQVMPAGTSLTAPALATHWARCGKVPTAPRVRDRAAEILAQAKGGQRGALPG